MSSPPRQDFSSPKRKRSEEPVGPQLQTSFLPRFPHFHPEHEAGGDSPRTQVTGRFQKLNLENYECHQQTNANGRETKRIAQSSEESPDSSPCPAVNVEQQTDGPSDGSTTMWPSDTSFTFEHANILAPPKEDKRPKSPSLGGDISDHYWHESEITGHDPDDPNDDGYGINGIGFRPTPAIAAARAQKRKQQLAEYRSRETKEARQKRSERRRGGSGEVTDTGPTAGETNKTKVRFEDG